jgi:tRNA modification GTPase
MQQHHLSDTIAAIATPIGEGGLAVIRLSGPGAFQVAGQCFHPAGKSLILPAQAPTHTLHYGTIRVDGEIVDEVMLAVMRAPRSFTREDTVEISCHGGILTTKRVLDALLHHGAKLAQPGEFTMRAFLNGRLDLAQAEAVADLIHAKTDLAIAAAHEQLAGKLSQRINRLRDQLMQILAHVEAHIDFPDEDIAPDTRQTLIGRLDEGIAFMDELLKTAAEGQILRQGIRAAIVGRPNTGKSSLLNQLLGHERAIVSAIPGTTRDTIQETANIRGLPVVFIDTAGLRESIDPIEQEGMKRSIDMLEKAELILHVLDASEPFHPDDAKWEQRYSLKKQILVLNKTDLPQHLNLPETWSGASVKISCATGQGIETLKDEIRNKIWGGQIQAEMIEVAINSRHQDALQRARGSTIQTRNALESEVPLELAAMDLRAAAGAVGEIVGKTATEDLLDSIFSQFCIGK